MKFYLVILSLILVNTLLSFDGNAEEQSLNIIYTGSLQSQLEPCGCSPKTDFGGIARLSGFLLKNADDSFFHVTLLYML